LACFIFDFMNMNLFFRALAFLVFLSGSSSIDLLGQTVPASVQPHMAASVRGVGDQQDPTRQTDDDWMDDRWQKMDHGRFLGAAIQTPGRKTPKGIAIKIGDGNEAAICFDTDLMRYSAGWTGGFLEMHARRYGLIEAPKPQGTIRFRSDAQPGWAKAGEFDDPRKKGLGPLPRDWAKYRGLYLHGDRVVLSYTVGAVAVLDTPWVETAGEGLMFTRTVQMEGGDQMQEMRICDWPGASGKRMAWDGIEMVLLEQNGALQAVARVGDGVALEQAGHSIRAVISPKARTRLFKIFLWNGRPETLPSFVAAIKQSPAPEKLDGLTRGGVPHWNESIVTRGVIGTSRGPFAIDTIPLPEENRWNALMFTSGHDFFENGDAAVATIHGDVWRVSGIDAELSRVVWKRFATGLYQPLGLKIVGNKVHVLERDQITILHDLNGSGEADFYENFNNDTLSAGGGHSYATCLETGPDGSFYFLKCAENTPHGGTLLRVSPDGEELEVIATGFRNPNGLGLSPEGGITVADQQGDWVPETRLDWIHPGGFYGFMPMHQRAETPGTYDPPLCWIPRAIDNSAGGQVWVPENHWGPFAGQMIHLSYGRCTMMLVLRDEANPRQGGVVPLPGRFLSGVMRARFHPHDGHLYLTGMRGWQTAAVRDGCFQRVRHTGLSASVPAAFAIRPQGIELTFPETLDREIAEDPESYSAEQWNYRWTANYGSPDYSVKEPDREGRDPVRIAAARLQEDGRTVFLEIPELRPVMQFKLQYNLEGTDGAVIRNDFYATIHQLNSN
jgi:hypothetical protein